LENLNKKISVFYVRNRKKAIKPRTKAIIQRTKAVIQRTKTLIPKTKTFIPKTRIKDVINIFKASIPRVKAFILTAKAIIPTNLKYRNRTKAIIFRLKKFYAEKSTSKQKKYSHVEKSIFMLRKVKILS